MQNANTLKIALGLALGFQIPAFAGSEAPVVSPGPAPSNPGNWCTWLQNKPGTLYKNKENPILQEFQLVGRFQYQTAYVDGSDVNGQDFNQRYDEYRRFRLGAKAKFLNYFSLLYQVNLVDDSRNSSSGGSVDWGYYDIDEAHLSFDLGKALGEHNPFDELQLAYGRHKFTFGQESHTSSTKLLTVERSAIANKVYGSYRPTGLTLEAAKGDWTFGAGLFSSTVGGEDNTDFNGWQDSVIYYLTAGYKASDRLKFGADFVYNDANVDKGEDSIMGYEWAASLNAQYEAGHCGVIGDLIYGDNGDNLGHSKDRSGNFWGVVVMPYYWIIEDKLQLVGQYQYEGSSEAEGVRVNSRYGRARVDNGIDVDSGRGDSHHSFYGGLNYYLCGHNAKIQGGLEYQTMDTPDGDFDTMTYVLAFRTFF